MYICFYFSVRLSFVVVYDIKIRIEQHFPVYIELKMLHASIVWLMLELKSADRILFYVLFWCNIPFSVQIQ